MMKFIVVLLISINLIANTNIEALNSLAWQKKDLELKMINRIEKVVKVLVQDDSYFVDVEIQSNIPETPKFDEPLNPPGEEEASAAATASLQKTLEKKEEEIKKKDEELKKSKALIKYDNMVPDDSVDDVIVFSKLGIEAPLIDDFNNFNPDGKIVLTMENGDDKKQLERIKEDFQKERTGFEKTIEELRLKGKNKPTVVEQMWKYNNTIDIFQNLVAVKIKIALAETLDISLRDKIEAQVKALNFNLGEIKPKYVFEYSIKKIQAPKEVTAKEKLFELLGLISKFSNVIASVGGMLLLAVVGSLLINKWFKMNNGTSSTGNFKMEGPENKEKDKDDTGDSQLPAGAGGLGDSFGTLGLNGIDRFKYFIENAPKEGLLLIKKWIADEDIRAKGALRALVQQLDNITLKHVFEKINEKERRSWQSLLEKPLNNRDLAASNDYISNQIVQSVIVPALIEDPETYDLILKLHHSKIPEMYKKDPTTTAILLNALNENFVAEVLMDCSPSHVNEMLSKALKYSPKDVKDSEEDIKELLLNFVEDTEQKPFVEKILAIVPRVTADVEKTIFDNLKDHVSYTVFRNVAQSYFPSELIKDLPEAFLKNLLSSYPLKKKIKMLLSVDEDTREYFLSIFAPEGTKASDLVKIEFEMHEKDPSEMQKIENERLEFWKDFVVYSRDAIKVEKQFKFEIDNLLNDWCERSMNNKKPRLQAVG